MNMRGAQIVCKSLLSEGCDVVFGIPGGAILPLYQTLPEFPDLRHILVRPGERENLVSPLRPQVLERQTSSQELQRPKWTQFRW